MRWYLFTVAQIFNLPYRRFVIGKAPVTPRSLDFADDPQVTNLRYSRLQVCATSVGNTANRYLRCPRHVPRRNSFECRADIRTAPYCAGGDDDARHPYHRALHQPCPPEPMRRGGSYFSFSMPNNSTSNTSV